jgi:hypothetical protein
MTYIDSETVTATTDGSGDATAYSKSFTGFISQIAYIKPGAASYSDGVDFTITSEATGEQIWVEENVNASKTVHPITPQSTVAGVETLVAGQVTGVPLANDRVKIVIASGGALKVGSFRILVA